jgi:hypothetical protein
MSHDCTSCRLDNSMGQLHQLVTNCQIFYISCMATPTKVMALRSCPDTCCMPYTKCHCTSCQHWCLNAWACAWMVSCVARCSCASCAWPTSAHHPAARGSTRTYILLHQDTADWFWAVTAKSVAVCTRSRDHCRAKITSCKPLKQSLHTTSRTPAPASAESPPFPPPWGAPKHPPQKGQPGVHTTQYTVP